MKGGFASLHPMVCFIYYVGLIVSGMLLSHPLYLVTAIAVTVLLLLCYKQGPQLRKQLPFYLLTGLTILVLNPLFSHRGRHILFYWMDQPITLESILYGLTMMLSLLTVLLAFVSFQHIITTEKFMYLFSKAAPKTSFLTLMSIRFVPLLQRRLAQISLIQATRGISVREGRLTKRLQDGMLLLRILLTWSMEEALQTADSMKARGYGTGRRSAYVIYRMDRRDAAVLAWLLAAGLACTAGWVNGYGILPIYPRLIMPRASLQECLFFGCYCAFLLTPLVVEAKEWLIWNRST